MGEDQAIVRLREILARPEYQVDQTLPWWQQLLAPLLDFVWSLISPLIQLVLASAAGQEGPIGAGGRSSGTISLAMPPVTLALLAANIGVFLLQGAAGPELFAWFALWPANAPRPVAVAVTVVWGFLPTNAFSMAT